MTTTERRIDWESVRARLRQQDELLERGTAITPADKARILSERAARLARTDASADSARNAIEAIVFRRGTSRFAVEVVRLQEIAVSSEIAPMPGTPSFCLGITNLRGEILPVFDLPPFFSSAEQDARGEGIVPERVLVLELNGRRIGVAADDVEDAVTVAEEDLDPPLATFAGRRAELVRAITREHALLIDASKLLDSEHLVIDAH